MKKIILLLVILISTTTVCFAGSIPEDLHGDDTSKLFFAEVLSYYPNSDNNKIVVHPVKNIKGDIIIGSKQNFEDCVPNNFAPIIGDVYLFAYYDDNNPTCIFEVTSYDTKTLKIKNIDVSGMWGRLQQYLNDGSYNKAEAARLEKLGQTAEVYAQTELPPIKNHSRIILYLAVSGIFVLLLLMSIFMLKRKNKKK